MDALAPVWLVAKCVLLLAGLLVPGALLMRALRLPFSVALSFAGSAAAVYATVLALQLTGVRISLATMAGGLAAIGALAFFAGRDARPARPPLPADAPGGGAGRPALPRSLWLPVYALFAAAVLWRAWREPLAGPDVEFRWSFLAEQMLRLGSLDFYPPRSAADFLNYFWAESIPPGVSALHAWAFACAGGASAAWTAPAVVLQLWSLHELVWRAAARLGGEDAGPLAVLAAAACPLLSWSTLLGQETGLTALALAGIVASTAAWRDTRAAGWAAAAGIFSALGGAAREYGLVFAALAAAGLLAVRADRRAWFAWSAAAALAFVWPLRTWLLTGNPFHSLDVAGIFPANPRFLAWIEHDAPAFGAALHTAGGWRDLARYLVLFAPAALLGWWALMVAATRRKRDAAWAAVACAAMLALWAISVRYTNGGLFYSLRVASPAFALGAIAAGVAGARLGRCAGVALCALVLATLPATLALPQNPWRTAPRNWPAFAPRPDATPDATLAVIQRALRAEAPPASAAAAPPVVLADAPGFQRRFLPAGIAVAPLWSPQADWLFDSALPPAEAARRWRASGVRFIVVTKWQANLDFLNARSRWSRPPFQLQPVGETPSTAVFAIRAAE